MARAILKRPANWSQAKALHDFDLRLLDYYAEMRDDLEELIENSTGPHQLFHRITDQAELRLHYTRRLLEQGSV